MVTTLSTTLTLLLLLQVFQLLLQVCCCCLAVSQCRLELPELLLGSIELGLRG
jgi:hypothetical protein